MLVTYFSKLNDHLSGKELFIRFTASAFRKLLSVYVFSYFPFGFEGRMWDLIVSVSDHFLSFLLSISRRNLTITLTIDIYDNEKCKVIHQSSDLHIFWHPWIHDFQKICLTFSLEKLNVATCRNSEDFYPDYL